MELKIGNKTKVQLIGKIFEKLIKVKAHVRHLNPENVTREIIQEMFNEENGYLNQIYNALFLAKFGKE